MHALKKSFLLISLILSIALISIVAFWQSLKFISSINLSDESLNKNNATNATNKSVNIRSNFQLSELNIFSQTNPFTYAIFKKLHPRLFEFDEVGTTTSKIINKWNSGETLKLYLIREEFAYDIQKKIKKYTQELKKTGISEISQNKLAITLKINKTLKEEEKKQLDVLINKIINQEKLESVHLLDIKQVSGDAKETFTVFSKISNFMAGVVKVWFYNQHHYRIIYRGDPFRFIKEIRIFFDANPKLSGEISEISHGFSWIESYFNMTLHNNSPIYFNEQDILNSILAIKEKELPFWSQNKLGEIISSNTNSKNIYLNFISPINSLTNYLHFPLIKQKYLKNIITKKNIQTDINENNSQTTQEVKNNNLSITKINQQKYQITKINPIENYQLSLHFDSKSEKKKDILDLLTGKIDLLEIDNHKATHILKRQTQNKWQVNSINSPGYIAIQFNPHKLSTININKIIETINNSKLNKNLLSHKTRNLSSITLPHTQYPTVENPENPNDHIIIENKYKKIALNFNNFKENSKKETLLFYNTTNWLKIGYEIEKSLQNDGIKCKSLAFNKNNKIDDWHFRIIYLPFYDISDTINTVVFPNIYFKNFMLQKQKFLSKEDSKQLNKIFRESFEGENFPKKKDEIETIFLQKFYLLPLFQPAHFFLSLEKNNNTNQAIDFMKTIL